MPLPSRILGTVLALSTLVVSADDKPADYSEGLERLHELGLADLKGAEWIEAPGGNDGSGPFGDYRMQQLGIRLKGGGWRTTDGRFVPMGGLEAVELTEPAEATPGAAGSLIGRMIDKYRSENPDPEKEERKAEAGPVDSMLVRDIDTLVGKLGESENRQRFEQWIEYGEMDLTGPLLIFAAQVHAAGHPELASRLAGRVFDLSPDRTAIIDGAVSAIADARYQGLASAFFENHDWKAFQTGLEGLLETFPRGWHGRLAAAMLLKQVRPRAEGAPVPEPSIEGIELPEEALECVAGWTVPPTGNADAAEIQLPDGVDLSDIPVQFRARFLASLRGQGGWDNDSGVWTLPEAGDEASSNDPVGAIKALGMDGLITLTALLGDETLTHFPSSSRSGSYFSSSESMAEKARRIYQSMHRPMARGEIAERLLSSVVPGDHSDPYGRGTESTILRERAIAFWKKHRDSGPVELAAAYLADGEDIQRHHAARHLATSDDPEAARIFEKTALESAAPLEMLDPVELYLQSRKAAARPFFEAFAKQLRETCGSLTKDQLTDLPGGWEIAHEGGIEGRIKKLGVLAGASSVEDLIAEALAAENDDQTRWSQLSSSLASIPAAELLVPFAEAVAAAEEDPERGALLGTFVQLTGPGTALEELSDEAIAAWKPLLDDNRPIPSSDTNRWFTHLECDTTAKAAALALELLTNPESYQHIQTHSIIADEPVIDLILRRVRALLDGGEGPAYISSEGVSDARRAELAKLADDTTPLELRSRLLALPPPERAAWLEWFQSLAAEEQEPPESLVKAADMVVAIDAGADTAEALGIGIGDTLDPATLEKHATTLLARAGDLSGLHVHARPARMNLGLELSVKRPGEEAWLRECANHHEIQRAEADAFAAVFLAYSGFAVFWQVRDGEITPVTEKQDDRFPAFVRYESMAGQRPFFPMDRHIIILTHEDLMKHRSEDSSPLNPFR